MKKYFIYPMLGAACVASEQNLSLTLQENEIPTVQQAEQLIDAREEKKSILVDILNENPLDVYTWIKLGQLLTFNETVIIQGKEIKKRMCYKIQRDIDIRQGLQSIGKTVEGATKKDFIQALKINPGHPFLWCELLGEECSEWTQKEIIKNIETYYLDESEGHFLISEKLKKDVLINGVLLGEKYFLIECLKNNAQHSCAWNNLGTLLTATETVTIDDKSYSKKDCYLESLEKDKTNTFAWNNLGPQLTATETVTIDGQLYSKKDCYLESLKLNKACAASWNNLGLTLTAPKTVIVDGESYSKKDCYLESLKLDKNYVASWCNLGAILTDTETVTIDDKSYSKTDCIIKSNVFILNNNQENVKAWDQLGNLLMFPNTVTIQGKEYNRFDCLQKAYELKNSTMQQ